MATSWANGVAEDVCLGRIAVVRTKPLPAAATRLERPHPEEPVIIWEVDEDVSASDKADCKITFYEQQQGGAQAG